MVNTYFKVCDFEVERFQLTLYCLYRITFINFKRFRPLIQCHAPLKGLCRHDQSRPVAAPMYKTRVRALHGYDTEGGRARAVTG